MRDGAQDVPVNAVDEGIERLAEAGCALGDRVEHRLDISRRTTDELENLASGGLPFQRLLRLGEQAHILDGDDGLVGEGLEQGDLPIGEAPGRVSTDADGPDSLALAQERYRDHAPATGTLDRAPREPGRGLQIGDMDDRPIEDGRAERNGWVQWTWVVGRMKLTAQGRDVVGRGQQHD